MKTQVVITALGVACLSGCSGKAPNDSSVGSTQAASDAVPDAGPQGDDRVAGIDPCSLLTDDEIGTAEDNRLPASQREGLHQLTAKYQVSKQEDRSGVTPVCHIAWRAVAPGNDERSKGTFDIIAMTASHLKSLEEATRPRTGKRAAGIPGIGDEAFYLEHAPSARVGNLGVSISEFGSADGGIELLKEAAARLH